MLYIIKLISEHRKKITKSFINWRVLLTSHHYQGSYGHCRPEIFITLTTDCRSYQMWLKKQHQNCSKMSTNGIRTFRMVWKVKERIYGAWIRQERRPRNFWWSRLKYTTPQNTRRDLNTLSTFGVLENSLFSIKSFKISWTKGDMRTKSKRRLVRLIVKHDAHLYLDFDNMIIFEIHSVLYTWKALKHGLLYIAVHGSRC